MIGEPALVISDPANAKSDSEAMYLYYKRQYELNELWIMESVKEFAAGSVPYLQCKDDIIMHLKNLRVLSDSINIFEHEQKKFIKGLK